MGLDISAYSHLLFVGAADSYQEDLEYNEYILQEWANPHFPHAVPAEFPIGDEGVCCTFKMTESTESYGFRAGSYSGYGLWRSTLAEAFLGTVDLYSDRFDANGMWEKVHNSQGKPFFELVNFSDCDGVFFGEVCEKLHSDFVNHRGVYEQFVTANNPFPALESKYFIDRYDDFTKAFDLARHNGLVSFH